MTSSLLAFGAENGLKDWGKELQKITDVRFRRASRFSQAVLCGALSCIKKSDANDFSVYFGTANGDVESTTSSQDNIFLQSRFPLPFSFINTLSNTPLFFLLQHLKLDALGISLAHSYFAFENALCLAIADLDANHTKCALVGACDTWYEPLHDAFRLIDKSFYEFSAWLILRKNGKNAVKFFDTFNELLDSVKNLDKETRVYFSPHLDECEKNSVERYIKLRNSDAPKTVTNNSAAIICDHFEKEQTPLFYIGKDIRGGYSFVSLYNL